ncbi:GNAT family N-acetyltransferase [Myroides odoratimimus]|uniref:N-acetyltransferase domain-containing protein n=1 Tax=Myroides odoratimimus CIP 101113 TaxID=883154 RepID=A0AAV3F4Z2_9FLAO|nr:GNAT family N-acetyltransferase [Myroides odoratimimus]EHO13840.1 hypothetical protein HMPREF9715_00914 [Myroides odoratimimus CIP 101113]
MFFLKKLARYILRYELNNSNKTREILSNRNQTLSNQNRDFTDDLKRSQKNKKRLLKIINEKKDKSCDLAITSKDEIVYIFTSGTYFISLQLYGTDSNHAWSDSEILYSIHGFKEDIVKIDSLDSNTKRKGYARTLMIYFIEKMKEQKVTEIYGDLSPVDKNSFDWLIPFYESLGFTCTLPTDNKFGKLRMYLNYE